MSKLVKSIRVHQLNVFGIHYGSRYFVGLEDFNVEHLFLTMLSNKLDKLLIENIHYPQYLTNNCAKFLEEVYYLKKKCILKIHIEAFTSSQKANMV